MGYKVNFEIGIENIRVCSYHAYEKDHSAWWYGYIIIYSFIILSHFIQIWMVAT